MRESGAQAKVRDVGRLLTALYLLGRIIAMIAAILAAIIALAIVLQVLRANPHNGIVAVVHDVARALVGPFDGMFKPPDRRVEIAVNWGIAMVVYLVVGWLISGLLRRMAPAEP